jgi:hypothetical protein
LGQEHWGKIIGARSLGPGANSFNDFALIILPYHFALIILP